MVGTRSTSWEKVHDWYDDLVGAEGHYYHQQIIIPRLLPLLGRPKKILDIGCGSGILAHHLPKATSYVGIDNAPSLIAKAQKSTRLEKATFLVQDATLPFSLEEKDFSHAAIILALQNMATLLPVLQNAADHLLPSGQLLLVLNHPCFRIPRQSSWAVDEKKQLQSRRTDCYMTPLEIPIFTRPSQKEHSPTVCSYHLPLSATTKTLFTAGFAIDLIEEWCSDKKSYGKAARRENRARREFPLFLAIRAHKFRAWALTR